MWGRGRGWYLDIWWGADIWGGLISTWGLLILRDWLFGLLALFTFMAWRLYLTLGHIFMRQAIYLERPYSILIQEPVTLHWWHPIKFPFATGSKQMARLLSWATITNVTPTMHDLDAKSGPFKISKSEVGLSFHRQIYPPVYGTITWCHRRRCQCIHQMRHVGNASARETWVGIHKLLPLMLASFGISTEHHDFVALWKANVGGV